MSPTQSNQQTHMDMVRTFKTFKGNFEDYEEIDEIVDDIIEYFKVLEIEIDRSVLYQEVADNVFIDYMAEIEMAEIE